MFDFLCLMLVAAFAFDAGKQYSDGEGIDKLTIAGLVLNFLVVSLGLVGL